MRTITMLVLALHLFGCTKGKEKDDDTDTATAVTGVASGSSANGSSGGSVVVVGTLAVSTPEPAALHLADDSYGIYCVTFTRPPSACFAGVTMNGATGSFSGECADFPGVSFGCFVRDGANTETIAAIIIEGKTSLVAGEGQVYLNVTLDPVAKMATATIDHAQSSALSEEALAGIDTTASVVNGIDGTYALTCTDDPTNGFYCQGDLPPMVTLHSFPVADKTFVSVWTDAHQKDVCMTDGGTEDRPNFSIAFPKGRTSLKMSDKGFSASLDAAFDSAPKDLKNLISTFSYNDKMTTRMTLLDLLNMDLTPDDEWTEQYYADRCEQLKIPSDFDFYNYCVVGVEPRKEICAYADSFVYNYGMSIAENGKLEVASSVDYYPYFEAPQICPDVDKAVQDAAAIGDYDYPGTHISDCLNEFAGLSSGKAQANAIWAAYRIYYGGEGIICSLRNDEDMKAALETAQLDSCVPRFSTYQDWDPDTNDTVLKTICEGSPEETGSCYNADGNFVGILNGRIARYEEQPGVLGAFDLVDTKSSDWEEYDPTTGEMVACAYKDVHSFNLFPNDPDNTSYSGLFNQRNYRICGENITDDWTISSAITMTRQ